MHGNALLPSSGLIDPQHLYDPSTLVYQSTKPETIDSLDALDDSDSMGVGYNDGQFDDIMTSKPSNVSNVKHSLLLQELQADPESDVESKEALARLLASQRVEGPRGGVEGGRVGTILEQELMRPDGAALQMFARAGIAQPVKRQIHLHSELARHLSTAAQVAAVAPQPKPTVVAQPIKLRVACAPAAPQVAPVRTQIIIQKVQPQVLQPSVRQPLVGSQPLKVQPRQVLVQPASVHQSVRASIQPVNAQQRLTVQQVQVLQQQQQQRQKQVYIEQQPVQQMQQMQQAVNVQQFQPAVSVQQAVNVQQFQPAVSVQQAVNVQQFQQAVSVQQQVQQSPSISLQQLQQVN